MKPSNYPAVVVKNEDADKIETEIEFDQRFNIYRIKVKLKKK
jgi:hypothetical protein